MVTKQDVANKAGVSTATVGRVISGKGYVSKEARERVEKAISTLNYRRNKLAYNLRKSKSNIIAVLVEDLLNPYYMHIVDAMARRAKKKIVSYQCSQLKIGTSVRCWMTCCHIEYAALLILPCLRAIFRGTTFLSKKEFDL